MPESDKEANLPSRSLISNAERFPPLGDLGAASVPIDATADVVFYTDVEWAGLDEADRASKIDAIKREFDQIVEELASMGDGASEESLSQGRNKKYFKLTLIILTGVIAIINLTASFQVDWAKFCSFVSAIVAIVVGVLGSTDSYFGFGEKSLNMMELHYRCRDTVTNLKARWAVAVSAKPDFKSYTNAWRTLDAAQREFQQINKLARQIMHDGEGKSSAPKS